MKIELHIERLVLDQTLLGAERASAVRAAIEHELGRLLATPDAFGELRGIGHVASLPPALLPPAAHPREALGPRIAAAVQHGLGNALVSAPAARQPGARR